MASPLPVTERTRHRRLREQGSTDRQDLDDILRAGLICHLGVIVEGDPMVVPTVYGLDGDTVYLHGSVASRSLVAAPRTTVCVTVTHLDGLVLARSVFEHAVNYRSAMIYGVPRLVTDAAEKLAGLRALSEHLAPGQWDYARRPNKKELAKTTLLALSLAESSVKIRTGPPDDGDSPDAALPIWAGVLPLAASWQSPEPDPVLPAGIPLPPHIAALAHQRAGWPRLHPGQPLSPVSCRAQPPPEKVRCYPGGASGGIIMSLALPLSTSGRFIVDARGRRVRLAGVNWAGASEDMGIPVGLDQTNRNTLAEIIAGMGFNCVRLPFSLWMTEQSHPVANQYLAANQDLFGKTPMEVYDACVRALTGAGLIVIPNCHLLDYGWCCSTGDENGLWFNDRWPAAKFTQAWQGIAKRYASNPLVAAMDIKNEPREATVGAHVLAPTWGTGGQTDIAAMYTTVGNLIHEITPGLLIICEGLNYATSLTAVASHPIKLAKPGKVVYSMHDYSWDHAPGQTQAAYAEQMNKAGGYILTEKIAPLWIGELGDNTASLNTSLAEPSQPDGAPPAGWWTNLAAWLTEADVDWCWWALNPTHGASITPPSGPVKYNWGQLEPYGLLTSDWTAAGSPALMKVLLSLTEPHTGPGIGLGAPPPGAT